MSSSIRRRAASIALCLGLVAGAAPAASPQDASSAAPKALRVASAFDPQTMDPHAVALLYHTRVVFQSAPDAVLPETLQFVAMMSRAWSERQGCSEAVASTVPFQ